MNKLRLNLSILITIFCGLGLWAQAPNNNCVKNNETCSKNESCCKSKVYFTNEITPEGLVKVFKALGITPSGKVAIKISTGESSKSNHLSPELIKNLVTEVNGTLVESNTAYAGSRNDSKKHREAIKERGYDKIADVDILDEEAEIKIPVKDDKWIKYDIVGSHLPNYDFMINLAHFKGHQMGGFGGVLKNASIGVASSNGKAYIHSAGKIETTDEIWKNVSNQDGFLESMAASAQAVHDYFKQPGKDIVYINVMNNMSVDCDCNGNPKHPELFDIGILASTDPVALDQASLDLVFNHENKDGDTAEPLIERINSRHGTHTVDYAEQIGLGSKNYSLIDINKKDCCKQDLKACENKVKKDCCKQDSNSCDNQEKKACCKKESKSCDNQEKKACCKKESKTCCKK